MPNKNELRRYLLETRQSLTMVEWKEKSDRIVAHLQKSDIFNQATTVLAYFSFRQEPDISPLFSDSQRRWGFPRCVGKSLFWHFWNYDDPLINGKFGISEPHPDATMINTDEVDLIIVPCVGCDRQGYRLGYGGGYYDRLLSDPQWSNIPTIGVVFDFAFLPQLPVECWDQPLMSVVTEARVMEE
ncbi:MAG: 5-formyltetrahydrofolate cyclo-ligase [Nostocales cyanobacterium]|nr:MAG: 5-formyltetrahydrofolate cyclo-ligase [Nostocales cyanobacterium]TAF19329.1 MAG: 5-formyltetrahydrofolate cyclo-ligase [Nostocales cyanobacterium]